MKKLLLATSILFLWTCGGGGGSAPTEPTNPYVIELSSLSGQAQKGPFNNGTAVNIAELTNTLSPTGRNFSTQIIDNSGLFSVANVQLTSPYVELRALGFYFNEVSNQASDAQLTLYALSDLTNKTSVNVNLLSHLEKNRIATLMAGTTSLTFAQAKNQAQEEVLAIFDYSRAGMPNSELLDITQAGANNAKLLAISAIVQGDLTVGQMSELLANISTDISTDGTLDNTAIQNTLIDNSKNLDLAQIRANLEARYASLGITVTIPDFETEVHQFLKPPVVQDMSLSTDEDTAINITLAGSDPEGESITYSLVDDSNNATVTINGNVANYVPNTHFNGTDTFTYKANDGTSDSNLGTVTITVNAIDDDPNTHDVSATTDEDTAVDISLTADEYDGQNYSFGIISNPSNGTVSLSGTTATYTPNQDWNGTDTFTFEATDDRTARTNVGTATITVNSVNDAPVSSNASGSTNEDTAVNITLSATDVEGSSLTYSVVATNDGSVSLSGTTATYTPDANWNGTDTFTYKANDGTADSNTATVTITVAAVNDAPTTTDISTTIDENRTARMVAITLQGSDIEGDDLTYSVVSDASNGTTSLSGATLTYTANQDWNGTETITYKANDGTVDSNTSTITVTVTAVNDAPVSSNVSASTNEDTAKAITLSATDVDGDNLTYSIVSNPSNGSLGSVSGTSVTYTPTANWNGTDTFTYKSNDGTVDSNTSTVTITVTAVNDAPTTNDVSATIDENRTARMVGITLDGSDIEGDDLTYSLVTNPSNGTASISGATLTYTANQDWNGTETFTYKANDGTVDSNTSTVTVTVTAVNDAPVSSDVSASTDEDTAKAITLSSNDVDGDNLTYSIVGNPSNGSLGSVSGTSVTYTPDANWNGTDTFTYITNDGTSNSNIGTVTVTVTAVNDTPVSSDASGSTDEDTAVNITLSATDVEGSSLTYSVVATNDGSVSISGTTATYTPDSNWNGTDTFTYKANDGTDDGNTATVTVTVAAVNDVPVANDVSASTNEDTAKQLTLSATDVEGTTLLYRIVSNPSNGSIFQLQHFESTSMTYTPNANWNGTDTFTYKVNENGTNDSNTATVTITVAAVNDAPTTTDIATTINENRTARMVAITLQGSDVDGDNLTYSIVSSPSNGTTSISGATLTYTANQDWNGTETFTYKANDGTVDSNTSTVTITVTAVNDAPVSSNVSASTNEDTAKTITLSATDVEGSSLTYSVVATNDGSVSISGATATYTPDANWNGTDTFTYKANDGTDDSNTSTVTVTVASVEDSPTTANVSASTNEDTAKAITLSGADGDSGDTLTYSVVSNPSNGSLGSVSGASVTYTPTANWNGTDTFTYKVNDGDEDSNTATVTVTVAAVNDVPIMTTQAITINEDIPTDITLSATDVDGDNLTYRILTVDNGSTSISGSTVTYTPPANLNGANADIIFWVANDGTSDGINPESGGSESKVFISINAVNDVPVASAVSASTNEDTAKTITLSATDVEGSSLTYSIVATNDGSVSISGATATYTPDSNWNGTDTFTYKANDGTDDGNTATVTVTVAAVNDAPTTNAVSASIDEDGANLEVEFDYNDIDSTYDLLVLSVVSTPSNGSLHSGQNGEVSVFGTGLKFVIYTPTANWNGTDTFTYKANDGTENNPNLDSNTSTVTITVTAVNDAPTSSNVSASTNEDTAKAITLSGADVDTGDTLTYSIVSNPSNGSLGSVSGTSVTYTPTANWNGTDTFTYKANDGTVDSNTSTVTVTVTAVNDAPTVTAGTISTNEDTAVTLDLSTLATDIDGDNLTFDNTPPGDGAVTINGSILTYTPKANWNGTEPFMVTANDGSVTSAQAQIVVTVAAVNDAPVSSAVSVSANEDIAKAITLSATDVEGSSLTYSIVSNPSNGSLGSVSGTSVTYTTDANWYGTDTFTYKANDGTDDGNTATVTVTVTSIPEHTIYPELTSGYDEFFNDIVYDKSTGGYSVGGFTRHTGDSGSGGTWAMTYLATNADLSSTTTYETVSTTLNGMGANINNARDGSVHFFDISERSTDGGFLVSSTSDYLNSVTSSATATYAQLSGSIASGYKWIDYIQASYQTSDGGYLIVGKVSKDGNFQDKYPVIAKIDASLNIDYFKILTNHVTNASLVYQVNDLQFVKVGGNDEDDTYYLAAETSVSGISGTNAIQYYKISDGGSSFTIDQYVNLSDIANSPTQIVSEGTSIDAMAYLGTGEFAIITNGGNGQQLTRYTVDSSGSATLESGSYDLSSYSNYMEILLSNNYIYIVVTSGDDIKVIQLSDTLSENWSRTLDITGLGYTDKLGGATATQFGTDGTGIAITGSTKNDDDWDGFIVIVDDAGNRIF